MIAPAINGGNGLTKKINLACILLAVILVLVLPLQKEIWYDETVSILCSKGISHDTPAAFASAGTLTSAQIEQLNTSSNVFHATIIDNANSFLYNYKLHWFTEIFGNTVSAYMLLSKLCAIVTLIAFYFLCRQFLKDSLFTGITVLLLVTDLNFIGMSHEIRAYSMGTMFVVLAAVFFYKFLLQQEKPFYLFVTSLFSVCALLSHFLAVYIVIVLLLALVIIKGKTLFSVKNIVAIIIPVIPLAVFVYFAYSGLRVMNSQSETIHEGYANYGFQLSEAILRSIKYADMNFKVIFPALKENLVTVLLSFVFVIVLYGYALRVSAGKMERRNLHLLFALGASSTVLLLILSARSHHYTSLYFRYHSFAIPFATLFTGYILYIIYYNSARSFVRAGLPLLFIIPSFGLFAAGIVLHIHKPSPYDRYVYQAREITKNNQATAKVQKWEEALLIQSLLPKGYKIEYFRADQ